MKVLKWYLAYLVVCLIISLMLALTMDLLPSSRLHKMQLPFKKHSGQQTVGSLDDHANPLSSEEDLASPLQSKEDSMHKAVESSANPLPSKEFKDSGHI